jgi:long-subunit fatty acid transport protein
MKPLAILILLAAFCLPALAQILSSPRATATGGYLAATDVYSIEWNMAATALGAAKIEATFGITEQTSRGDYRLLLRPSTRHVAAIFRTGAQRVDHLTFQTPLPVNRTDRTPLHFGYDLSHEFGWGFGYAYQKNAQIAFGLDVRQHAYSNTFTSNKFWSLNLSFAHRPKDWLSLGVAFRNAVSYNYDKPENNLTYTLYGETKTTSLSLTTHRAIHTSPDRRLETGIALKPAEELLLTLDFYSNMDYAAGFEWRAARWLALRMAASKKHDQLLKHDRFFRERRVLGLAWGMGISFKFVAMDFAYYKPYGNADAVIDTPATGQVQILPSKDDLLMLAFALAF